MQYNLANLEKKYNLELDRIISTIKNRKAKNVLLQFPDGLKPYAVPICEFLEEKTSADIKIFLGTCFGACDIPQTEADLLVQFGHAKW